MLKSNYKLRNPQVPQRVSSIVMLNEVTLRDIVFYTLEDDRYNEQKANIEIAKEISNKFINYLGSL